MITKNPEKLENKFGLPKVHADLEMETITVGTYNNNANKEFKNDLHKNQKQYERL